MKWVVQFLFIILSPAMAVFYWYKNRKPLVWEMTNNSEVDLVKWEN